MRNTLRKETYSNYVTITQKNNKSISLTMEFLHENNSTFICLTLWHPAGFGDFRQKKHLYARGFADEYLRSCSL